jgi:ribosome-binding protein aMBF1 (putative translation factor)
MSVHTRTRHTKRLRPSSKAKAPSKGKGVSLEESFKDLISEYSSSGLALRGCRYKKGISQKNLAKSIHISQHHISEMENGKRVVGKEMAKRFANFFETDYRIFL